MGKRARSQAAGLTFLRILCGNPGLVGGNLLTQYSPLWTAGETEAFTLQGSAFVSDLGRQIEGLRLVNQDKLNPIWQQLSCS